MKYFLSYFIFLIMPITSCNQVRPDVFLDVYPDVSNNDTIYYLQITIKNKSHLPLYLDQCDYLSHYLQVFDYKGHNSKKEYDGWGYFDGRQSIETNYHILVNRKQTTDSFINIAVDDDFKRIMKLNFFLRNDTVYDNAIRRVLNDKYENVLLLNPGETVVQFELINSFYRKHKKSKIEFKYQNKPYINIFPGFMHLYKHLDGRDGRFFLFQIPHGLNEVNGYKRFKGKIVSAPLVIN